MSSSVLFKIAKIVSGVRLSNRMTLEEVTAWLVDWINNPKGGQEYRDVQPTDRESRTAYDVMSYLFVRGGLKKSGWTLNAYLTKIVEKMQHWIDSNESLRKDPERYKKEMTAELLQYGVPRGVYMKVFGDSLKLMTQLEEANLKRITGSLDTKEAFLSIGLLETEYQAMTLNDRV
jgi:hypothetical protein